MKNDKGRVLAVVILGIIVIFISLHVYIQACGTRKTTGWKTTYTHDENGELIDHSVRSRYPDY
jgi:hypothetical protein